MNEISNTSENKKWSQYLTTFSSVIATFCAGIHYSWPTPSLPQLLSKNYPLNITSTEASYIVTIASVGDIVGNIVFTLLADRIGRKPTILLIASPQIFSMLLLHVSSSSVIFLYLARFLGGVGEGATLCVIPIYVGEIAEPKIRGVLISFFSISWSAGCLFINIVGSYYTIQTTSLITLIFPLLFLGTFVFVPESPYYLLMKEKLKQAQTALKQLRCNDNIEDELSDLYKDVRRQMSETGRYKDLFKIKTNRSALFIMSSVIAISEFSGISSLTFYAQLFFMKTTDVLPKHWAASLIIFLQLVFSIVSSLSIDYMGRRPLLLSSIAGCGSSLFVLSLYFFLIKYLCDLTWIPLAAMIVFVVFFNLGVANVVNCLNGELFSASIKTKAACVSAIFYSLCVVVVTKIYQILSDSYGLGAPLLVFTVFQVLGWVFCWRFVPETNGKSLEEIQQEIKMSTRMSFEDSSQEPLLNFS